MTAPTRALRLLGFLPLLLPLLAACELISQVDRSKISDGGAAGAAGAASGGGGTSGSAGSGGSGGVAGSGGIAGAAVDSGLDGSDAASGGAAGADAGDGGCQSAGECPPNGSECVIPTCVGGVCGADNVASGTPTTAQTAGDCTVVQCDGSGATVDIAEPTDVSDDGNDCTIDACSGMTPTHDPVAQGTACGTGGTLKCDAQGKCVGCAAPTDCPGQDTDCKTRTCTSGQCGFNFATTGTVTTAQTAGDCKKTVCDGAGNTSATVDDNDLPVDGKECTNDVCTNGVPSNPPKTSGTACSGSGIKCDGAGACVQCLAASDCGANTECKTVSCTNNTCGGANTASGFVVSGQTTGDCKQNQCNGSGAIVAVNLDTDLPVDGNSCTLDLCSGGVASNPPAPINTPCNQGGVKCNGAGACVNCTSGGDCPSLVCQNFSCAAATCADGVVNGSETDTDCGGGTCGSCAPGKSCLQPSDCQTGSCSGNACAPPAVVSTNPADGAAGVSVSTTIGITFLSSMNATTLTAQTTAGACTGTVQVSSDDFSNCIGFSSAAPVLSNGDTTATFTPSGALASGTLFKVRVTAAAKDTFGNPLGAPYTSATGFSTP